MRKKLLWAILLAAGLLPFLAPLIMSITRGSIPFSDWLVLWSYIYWPTYLPGLALVILSAAMLLKNRIK